MKKTCRLNLVFQPFSVFGVIKSRTNSSTEVRLNNQLYQPSNMLLHSLEHMSLKFKIGLRHLHKDKRSPTS